MEQQNFDILSKISTTSPTSDSELIDEETDFVSRVFSPNNSFGTELLEKYCYLHEYNLYCLLADLRDQIQSAYPEIILDKQKLRKVLNNELSIQHLAILNDINLLSKLIDSKIDKEAVLVE